MGIEIERKFLVSNDAWRASVSHHRIFRQGYIVTGGNEKGSVRVRVSGESAWLNMKSATRGAERLEFEYPLPLEDAMQILDTLCQYPIIEKTRYYIEFAGHTWEVDVFDGENQGLIVAEVELDSVDERLQLPEWVGNEVTDDVRYYNACLVKNPFSSW